MVQEKSKIYSYSKYILVGFFSVLLLNEYAQAQENENIGQKISSPSTNVDSIDIVRDYRPMLADAVKVRRSPDMQIDRKDLEAELRYTVASLYFDLNDYRRPFHSPLQERYPEAPRNNIDNNRIGILAYHAGEYERASSILKKVKPADAFYQSSIIALGKIAQETGDKLGARAAFHKASSMDYDQELKADALYNYAKVLGELDSIQASVKPLQEYLALKYQTFNQDKETNQNSETRTAEILSGGTNFETAVHLFESFSPRKKKADAVYQKITYYRGLEFYNERAFENSISMFMRAEKLPVDMKMAALATYWKAEAMYEVRKYKEAVENFTRFMGLAEARNTDVYNYANYALAYAAFRIDSYSMAAQYFEKYLATTESKLDKKIQFDVIARLGDAYLAMRNYHRATEYYDQLITNKAPNQDYALFQHGIIQGLQGNNEAKLQILRSVVEKFPSSNYADDVAFEIPYVYFLTGNLEGAIEGFQKMMQKYPRSSYVPRALLTIGLVQYSQDDPETAMATFKKVIKEYSTSNEAGQAMRSIENIYLDKGDATSYIQYAMDNNVTDLSPAEQDKLVFDAGLALFTRGQYMPAVEAINAYFDKFPKPRQEKYARYIRGVSLYHSGQPREALIDLNIILNDWTSPYTENTLLTAAALYLSLKEYNEAIVHLKKLEINTDYKANYGYAVTNLMVCYFELGDLKQMEKYAKLTKNYERASDEEIATVHLYTAKAMLKQGDKKSAQEEMNLAALKSQSAVSAEARYQVALLQFENKEYDKAQKSAFDVIENMDAHDYWVARSFILLADTYARKGNTLQARQTLKSIIDNYEGDDDIIPLAKQRLQGQKKK